MLNRVRERIHPQELIAARAAAEAAPLAPRPAPKPLGWGRAMLDHLNAEAPVIDLRAADGRLGVRRPVAPKPRPSQELLAWHSLASLYAVTAVHDHVAAEVEALLAELAELAPFTAKGGASL